MPSSARTARSAGLLSLSCLLAAWSAGLSAQPADPAAAASAADLALARAVAERDVAAFKALIAPDGVFLGAGVSHGPEAVAAGWAVFFDPESRVTLTWEPRESGAAASGELAYTIGSYELASPGADGKMVSRTGEYLTLWVRDTDGRFRVAGDGTLSARDPQPLGLAWPELGEQAPGWLPAPGPRVATSLHREPERVRVAESGDLAYALGNYTIRTAGEGEDSTATGAYLVLWKREGDGPWHAAAEAATRPRAGGGE